MSKNNFITLKKATYNIPLLFCCDHASNLIPPEYKNLGLKKSMLKQHIAFDIGAKKLTKILAKRFSTNYILAKYSRIFIDLNRDINHENLISEFSDKIHILGNKNLEKKEIKYRIKFFHKTYHNKISDLLNKMDQKFKCKTSLICIHTFTPSLKNKKTRPWDIGLLHRKDKRLYTPIKKYLKNIKNLNIGNNLPYSGYDNVNYTMTFHGEKKNRPFLSIEIKNDVFKKKNKKKLKKIIDSITLSIYKSQITLGKPYNEIILRKLNEKKNK